MIDTLRIYFPLYEPLSNDVLAKLLIEESARKKSGRRIINDGTLQVIPHLNTAVGRVVAQASLPKLLRGTNVEPLSLEETIEQAERLVTRTTEKLQISKVPTLQDVQVSRADYVYDWIVDSPAAYLVTIGHFAIVRRNHDLSTLSNRLDLGVTLNLGSGRQNLKLYDKEAQVDFQSRSRLLPDEVIDKAKGRLRAELRLAGRGWRKYLGDDTPHLAQVLEYLKSEGRRPLVQAWERATEGWSGVELEADVVKLIETHGSRKGRQLSETLSLVRTMGVQNYRQICRPDDSTWYRFRKALRMAGVDLTTTGGLPLLTIPQFDTEVIDISRLVRPPSKFGGQGNG